HRVAGLGVQATDQTGGRAEIDFAAIPGGRRIRAGIRPFGLPGPIVTRFPQRSPSIGIQAQEVLPTERLALGVYPIIRDDETGMALAQLTRPESWRSIRGPRVGQAGLAGDAIIVDASEVRPIGPS